MAKLKRTWATKKVDPKPSGMAKDLIRKMLKREASKKLKQMKPDAPEPENKKGDYKTMPVDEKSGQDGKIDFQKRAITAVKLRNEGYSYRQIARILGISTKNAFYIVDKAMKETRELYQQECSTLRQRELDRLDEMQRVAWKAMKNKSSKNNQSLFAISQLLAIMTRRAKMLGLDPPVGVSLAGSQDTSPKASVRLIFAGVDAPQREETDPSRKEIDDMKETSHLVRVINGKNWYRCPHSDTMIETDEQHEKCKECGAALEVSGGQQAEFVEGEEHANDQNQRDS